MGGCWLRTLRKVFSPLSSVNQPTQKAASAPSQVETGSFAGQLCSCDATRPSWTGRLPVIGSDDLRVSSQALDRT